ncbi:hypothetical protein L6164_023246 [Bauhinia variegata]|uniref:Uncharacterized protein n=1 Tax=Bauhinia variegata TaxID=167791 RepID=A0ACB9MJ02_BAUVA|nr:hypothetical protein L6164_023246 [Bauhinia variegata]
MSASTVSITAANPTARRRPVVATEKKTSNIELLANDVGVSPGADGGGDEKVTSAGNARDLSHHSIRGEAVLERSSKDYVQVKKPVGNSTVLPRRTRKVPSKPEKPRWVTVVRVVSKNAVLLLVLVGLVHLIRRLALKSGDGLVGTPAGLSEFEGRLADVESLVKTTTKMIQLQVEVVDRKIENEIGGLRKEVNQKIDDKGAIWESELKELKSKNGELERSLDELKAVNWLSKEEFDKIVDDFKKAKGGTFGDASLDEIRAYAREVIEKEIEKHAADGLGMVDYALGSGGAKVAKHSEAYLVSKKFSISVGYGVQSNADKMLQPSFGEPGQCFALKGSSGFVQIRLRTAIIPEAVTLEHVAKSVAYDRSSAPKDCRVFGWLQGRYPDSALDAEKLPLLTKFSYDLEKSNAQTFSVLEPSVSGAVDTKDDVEDGSTVSDIPTNRQGKKQSFINKIVTIKERNRRKMEGGLDGFPCLNLFAEVQPVSTIENSYFRSTEPAMSSGEEIQNLRVFVATWNVGGQCPSGNLDLSEFLQEIVPLNAGNVLVLEDNEPATKWLALINHSLNGPEDLASKGLKATASFGGSRYFQKPCFKKIKKTFKRINGKRLKNCNCVLEMEKKAAKDFCFRCQDSNVNLDESSSEEDNDIPQFSVALAANWMRYRLVVAKQMVGIFVSVWMKKELVQHVGHLRVCCTSRGIMGCLGDKGCISVSMSLYQRSLCFISVIWHLVRKKVMNFGETSM